MLTLCNVVLSGDNPLITLHTYNMETGNFREKYSSIISQEMSTIERPVFTYNSHLKTYNITLMDDNENILCVNLKANNNSLIPSITFISPVE